MDFLTGKVNDLPRFQVHPILRQYMFSAKTMVQQVIMRPKENVDIHAAEWQIISSVDACNFATASWTELIEGKIVARSKPDEVFVGIVPRHLQRWIRCLGIHFSHDNWLNEIEIWKRDTTGKFFHQQ